MLKALIRLPSTFPLASFRRSSSMAFKRRQFSASSADWRSDTSSDTSVDDLDPAVGKTPLFSSLEQLLALHRTADDTFVNSSELFIPYRGRGLFGGTLAAQATLAALLFTNSPKKRWKPVSTHCHFLFAAQPQPQLEYRVLSLKDGKNYCSRAIDLFQGGRLIFRATCMLEAYDLQGSAANMKGQLDHHRRAPVIGQDILPPEQMLSQEDAFSTWAKDAYHRAHLGYLKDSLEAVTASYAREPCVWRLPKDMFDLGKVSAAEKESLASDRVLRYWVKTKEELIDPDLFSWVAMAYISDYFYLSANMRLNLREMFTTKFSVSLDHTIYFNRQIDVADWFNYNVRSLKSGDNRTIMAGEIFAADGTLAATTIQEGLSVVYPEDD